MYNPSLLIVGNRVYAKGDDGAFYPGLIEGKLMQYYDNTVQLANDKRKQVHEEDLVWLGFYGVPSSCWPENPVVQPTSSTEKTFEGTMKFVGNAPPKWPASRFTVRGSNDENEQYSLGRHFSSEHESLQLLEGEKLPTQRLHAPISEEQRVKEPRSSVIRLNRDLLHKETSYDRPMDRLMPRRPSMISLNETTNLIPGYAENKSELHNKYNTKISPLHYGESLYSTKVNADDALRRPPKVNIDPEGERGRETTEQIRVDWGKTFSLNQSNLTPPTPTYDSVISSPRGLSVFRTIHASVARAQSSVENTPLSSSGQTKKRRKRSDTKKCRKVYGIDNREAWCTQCKWKKACTQFKECDKKILDNCAQEDFGSEVSIGA